MNKTKIIFTIFLIIAFLTGIYVILSNPFSESSKEKLDNMNSQTPQSNGNKDNGCPNLLIQKGNVLMLYNTNQPMEDGKNPIPFFNLDEYINYLEIQRSQGINCPVLYLQQENNTQGQDVYRMRPSPFDLQAGLPTMVNNNEKMQVTQVIDSGRDNKPYNANNYAGFDPQGLHIGEYTNLDQIHDSTKQNQISDNPMDPNWAGVTYTQQMIDSGKYEENNVTRPILFTPHNTVFYPTVQGPTKNPVDIL